jgi:hypothetical protein
MTDPRKLIEEANLLYAQATTNWSLERLLAATNLLPALADALERALEETEATKKQLDAMRVEARSEVK